jgi:monofunctional glycosyltransferase
MVASTSTKPKPSKKAKAPKSKKWSFPFILRKIRAVIIWFFILSISTTILFRFVPIPFTPLMIIRLGEQLFHGESLKLKKDWVPLKEISPKLPLAVVSSEDQLFLDHWGFDFNAIEKAMKNNNSVKKKKKIKGGSTISQQTAKNVFLWPGRSWIRKGFEVYFTMLIEGLWSKERIMEVYLNVIEMGDGIYGAESASRIYFKRPARNISFAQAALIAAVLPNPRRWNPAHPSSYIYKRQQWILRNMNNLGPIDF